MSLELYKEIEEAYNQKRYYRVTNLVKKILKTSNEEIDEKIFFMYGYALLMINEQERGISIFKILSQLGTSEISQKAKAIVVSWEEQKKFQLPLKEYLEQGYELKEGVIVYLNSLEGVISEAPARTGIDLPYMIWKIENNIVYAFPIRIYRKHGHYIQGRKYFKSNNQAVEATLVSFAISNISAIDIILDSTDCKSVIGDLYKRCCVLSSVNNTPKNHFVSELEKKILIEENDIISIFDVNDRHPHYYYVIKINKEDSIYYGVEITHINGEITLKNKNVVEIPKSSYILEKLTVSPLNIARINEIISDPESFTRKRTK